MCYRNRCHCKRGSLYWELNLAYLTDNLRRYRNTGGTLVVPVSRDDGPGIARDDGGGPQHRQDARRIQDRQLQQRLQKQRRRTTLKGEMF